MGSFSREIDGDVRPHPSRDRQPFRNAVHGDDACRATQPRARRRAQTDRPLGEYHDRVADLDAPAFRTGKAGAHDVRTHQYLFVCQIVGNRLHVGHRIGYQQIFRLATVDGIAEPPAADRFPAVCAVTTALRGMVVQTGIALSARGDRADDDALADTVAGHAHAEFLDDADGFMTDDETGFDGIFPFQDMDIGTADGGRRDSDQRLAGADFGNGFFIQNDLAGFDEYCRFHGTHRLISILVWNWAEKASFHPTGNTGVTGTGLPGSCLWPCRYRSLACR